MQHCIPDAWRYTPEQLQDRELLRRSRMSRWDVFRLIPDGDPETLRRLAGVPEGGRASVIKMLDAIYQRYTKGEIDL